MLFYSSYFSMMKIHMSSYALLITYVPSNKVTINISTYVFVESRANFNEIGDGFDHFVAHALSCTLDSEDVSVMGYGSIYFGSFNEVIHEDDWECLK